MAFRILLFLGVLAVATIADATSESILSNTTSWLSQSPSLVPVSQDDASHSIVIQPQSTSQDGTSPSQSLFIPSLLMIIISEIGDKTFLIAAIMAMKHSRLLIFSSALSALAVMSVLSAILGCTLPGLISKKYTQILAALLFFVFGLKMLKEGYDMSAGHINEELEEVTQELNNNEQELTILKLEEGKPKDIDDREDYVTTQPYNRTKALEKGLNNLLQYIFSPVYIQTFMLTFLAEWGDRSQIATVALAAAGNVYMVIIGTILGHSVCTGLAVLGGRFLATKISVRTVTICGGFLFVVFAILTGFYHAA